MNLWTKILSWIGRKNLYKYLHIIATRHELPIRPYPSPDERDWNYSPEIVNISPPKIVDLSEKFNVVRNQLSLGSCQSFALISIIEYMWNTSRKELLDLSEMYTFYAIRYWNGVADQNVGAYIIDTVKSPMINGYCFEENMSYSLDYKTAPSMTARIAAGMLQLYKIPKSYYKISTSDIDAIKQALNEGIPIIFGMHIYNSFYGTGTDGIIPTPKANETSIGGHAMVIVGYNDNLGSFKVRNSWGIDWGSNGYGHLPYGMVSTHCFDMYGLK